MARRIRKIDDVKATVKCRKCGWKWNPDPNRWRNRLNMVAERTLNCPSCQTPNRLRLADVKMIWKYNYALPRLNK